jgi:TP901 family phage tail tape measure protein
MANTEKIVVQVVVQGEKDLQRLEKRTGRATKSVGGLTKSLAGMTGGILTATAAFQQVNKAVGSAIKTFTKFEFEMAKVKAITGATQKDFKQLTNTSQQLGRSTFFTASQVAELQVNFGKLGFSTEEILNAQEATLQLATATQSDLGRAAIVAGAAVRGFGLDASETQRVVDVMAVAFTSSALDIEKFQTSMTKVAPIAAAASVSIELTSAVMGTLTDAGIEASIAGTSLRNIFLKMQDPASDLSKHLGFTVNSSADLEKALTQLNSEGLSNAEMMQLVDLRQVAAFQTMVAGADRVLELTDALENANGEAQKMADIMADTLQGDILKAKSAWEGFEISIMTGSSNISKSLRLVISDFTEFISGVVDNMQTPEQLGAKFLTDSLKAIKEQQEEIDKLLDSGQTAKFNVNIKTRAELLLDEIEKLERVQKAQKDGLKLVEEESKGFGARSAAAQRVVDDFEKQILAREQALKSLNEILDKEIKLESNKKKQANLLADIEAEKRRRAEVEADKKALEEKLKAEQNELKQLQQNHKTALQQELNDDKQNLIDGLITEEEFNNRKFEAEQAHLENMRNLNIAYGEDVTAINSQILDNQLKMIADRADAEASAAQEKLSDDEKIRTERQKQIDGVSELGQQLITLAGEDEKMQGVRKAGIQISAAAAIANNLLALSNAAVGVSEQSKLLFPANIVAMLTTISTIMSLFANIKALKDSFGDGGVIEEYANGGMVHGKSHAQGGEKFAVGGRVVELEGGEAVINKRSTAMFRNQLSAMNAAGGGVKFADGGMINQPSFSQQEFNVLGQNQMMGAMGGASKVVVVESDITSAQREVSVVESDAKI